MNKIIILFLMSVSNISISKECYDKKRLYKKKIKLFEYDILIYMKNKELTIPCDYHPNDIIKRSKENPDAWICASCKKEKVEGRDGIYDMNDLIKLINQMCEKKDSREKFYIRDEVWDLFSSKK